MLHTHYILDITVRTCTCQDVSAQCTICVHRAQQSAETQERESVRMGIYWGSQIIISFLVSLVLSFGFFPYGILSRVTEVNLIQVYLVRLSLRQKAVSLRSCSRFPNNQVIVKDIEDFCDFSASFWHED